MKRLNFASRVDVGKTKMAQGPKQRDSETANPEEVGGRYGEGSGLFLDLKIGSLRGREAAS